MKLILMIVSQNIRDMILSQQYYYQKKTEHKIYLDAKLDSLSNLINV